jgi:carbon-monoxide dehydrogenase medium subunit
LTDAELGFHRATDLEDALAAISEEGAMLVAGATSVGVLLKNRLIEPERLVWIGALSELGEITLDDEGALHLGATATIRELHRSPLVAAHAPVLATAARNIGNPRVRAIATVGGAIVHGDPRQDLPPVLLALRATAVAQRSGSRREIDLASFYLGFMDVELGEDELVTEVVVASRVGWADVYSRFTPGSDDDYPTVGVAASLRREADGTISDAVLALGGVDAAAIVVPGAATAVIGTSGAPSDLGAAAEAAMAACSPGDDARGSAHYKRAMVGVWTKRTLAACLAQS